MKKMKVIIAAAGTGGHINPGLAIANKIMEKEPNSKIIFIGTPRGLENDLVPRAGFELKTINAYGIKRSISLDNIRRLCDTVKSVGEAKKILKNFKPDVVIGTGGYICVSVGIAANILKIPLVLHESNAYPGVAVKLLAKKASKVLLGFEDAKNKIPSHDNVVVTGTPSKIHEIKMSSADKFNKREELKIKQNMPLVLVFGGSQGASSINKALIGIIQNRLNQNYQIMWAAGKENYEKVKKDLKEHNIDIENVENAKIVPYIYNMQEAMEVSDLVVARSGAMTITEISVLGKPAIFIPFPFAAENHQEYNAKVLANIGAAKIILDKNLGYVNLNSTINSMVENKEKLKQTGEKAKSIAKENVEEEIYEQIKLSARM